MQKEDKNALILLGMMIPYLFINKALRLITTPNIALGIELVILGTLLFWQRKIFRIKLRFDWLAIPTGILIAGIWISIGLWIQPVGNGEALNLTGILLKIVRGVIIASVFEEFFTRWFLHRFITTKKWLSAKIGMFSWKGFIITTLFFGFAHQLWIAGIISGILLNILWYKRKDMNSVVQAHAIANLVLGIVVARFHLWGFWN